MPRARSTGVAAAQRLTHRARQRSCGTLTARALRGCALGGVMSGNRAGGVRPARWLLGVGQDLRAALRLYAAAPLIAAVAVLSLGLGIGSTTAIFSLINGVYLRPLPIGDPSELVYIKGPTLSGRAGARDRRSAPRQPRGARAHRRLLRNTIRYLGRQRGALGRRALGQRLLLRNDGRQAVRWPAPFGRRRRRRRRRGRARGRHQPCVVAAPLSQRPRHDRPDHRSQPRTVHDRRDRAGRLLRAERRAVVRRRRSTLHGGCSPRGGNAETRRRDHRAASSGTNAGGRERRIADALRGARCQCGRIRRASACGTGCDRPVAAPR